MTQKVNYPEQINGVIQGGGGSSGVGAQDEGIYLGTGTVFNFMGPMIRADISGSVVRVTVTGTPVSFDDLEGDPADVTISGTSYDGGSLYPSRRDHRHKLQPYEIMDALNVYFLGTVSGMNINYNQSAHAFNFDALTLQDIRYMQTSGWETIDTLYTGTYVSADAPTYKMSFPTDLRNIVEIGQKFRCSQSSTLKYFFVTDITGSVSSTTLTLYGGTDYTLANAAITAPCYSKLKKPAGFPIDPDKWTVSLTDTTNASQGSPTNNTYYNVGSLSINVPIGSWRLFYSWTANIVVTTTALRNLGLVSGLSTTNNAMTPDNVLRMSQQTTGPTGANNIILAATRERQILLTTKTTYYLIVLGSVATDAITSIAIRGDLNTTVVKAICSYL